MSHETRLDRAMQKIEPPNECDRNTAWVSLQERAEDRISEIEAELGFGSDNAPR